MKKPARIIFVRTTQAISGAETYNYNLVEGLAKHGDAELFFISDNAAFLNRLQTIALGMPVYKIKGDVVEVGTKKDLLRFLLRLPFYLVEFISILHSIGRTDKTVLCLQSMSEKIFFTPIVTLLGYTVVWVEHGPLFRTQRSGIIKILYRLCSGLATSIIAVSADTNADLVSGGVDAAKIQTMYIGINTDRFAPADAKEKARIKKELGIPPACTVVGYVGSINRTKGVYEAAEIINSLLEKKKNVFGLMVGNGPDDDAVGELLQTVDGKRCMMVGFTDHPQQYYKIIDIFLFLSGHQEGLSMSLLEAAFSGTSILASRIGGNDEILSHLETVDAKRLDEIHRLTLGFARRFGNDELVYKETRDFQALKEAFGQEHRTAAFHRFFTSV